MMKVLKVHVHSMAWLEGSMVEGYVLDKTLEFVINYLHEFEHVSKRIWDAKEKGVFGKVLKGVCSKFVLRPILKDLAYKYVLTNTKIIGPWI